MTDQSLACPDCGAESFTVSALAVLGPKDLLGLRCEGCRRAVAKVAVENARADVREAVAEAMDA